MFDILLGEAGIRTRRTTLHARVTFLDTLNERVARTVLNSWVRRKHFPYHHDYLSYHFPFAKVDT